MWAELFKRLSTFTDIARNRTLGQVAGTVTTALAFLMLFFSIASEVADFVEQHRKAPPVVAAPASTDIPAAPVDSGPFDAPAEVD